MTKIPPSPLLTSIHALIAVMEEESETLALLGPVAPVTELAQAKARLASRMDREVARLNRETPGWQDALHGDARRQLAVACNDLHAASVVNSEILERQIDLSSDMLAAIGLEMERLTGHGATTYGALGKVRKGKGRSPLSVNTQL